MAKAKKESGIVFAIALLVIMVVAVVFTIVTAYSEPVPTEATTVQTAETTPETEAYKEIRIAVFETSDIHGYIMDTAGGDKNDFQYRLAYIAKAFSNARDSGDYDDVVIVDAGDIYQGSPVSNLSEGAALRAALDYMHYDAVAAGNHEFDWDFTQYGADASATVPAYEFGSYSGNPDIPVLSANIYNTTNHRRSLLTKDYVIVEKAGIRIALIGYTPDYSSEILSSKIEEFEFNGDLTEFSNRVKEINEAEQPAVTIVVAHEAADIVANALDPADVDLVIGAPDSGNAAAEGYAAGLGVQYGAGLLKNRYVGRTFIKSTQQQRELAVRMKFAALKTAIKDKKIAIVDDSLVRGTTTKHIITFLRENGAKEVHVRLASPPVRFGCCYGVNASSETELPASSKTVEEIRDMIGADSLAYISLDSLRASLNTIDCGVCSACFDGDFIAGKPDDEEESIHKIKYN